MTNKQNEIVTERMTLRPLRADDCGQHYVDWLADKEINQYLETRHRPQTHADIQAFVESVNAKDNEHLFGMFLSEERRHIGNIKVGPIGTVHPVADVSLLIGARDCWGQGYAGEAIRAVSRHAFDHLKVSKLSASMYAPNKGSMHAFLKVGYRQEGVRRAHYMLDGNMCDVIELGAVSQDIK